LFAKFKPSPTPNIKIRNFQVIKGDDVPITEDNPRFWNGFDVKKMGQAFTGKAKLVPGTLKVGGGAILQSLVDINRSISNFYNKTAISKVLPLQESGTIETEQAAKQLRETGFKEVQQKGQEFSQDFEFSPGMAGYAEKMAAAIPQMATSFGLTTATLVVTRNPLLASAVGVSTNYAFGANEVYTAAREFGLSDEEALPLAQAGGAVIGAVDFLPFGRLLKKLGAPRAATKLITNKMAREIVSVGTQAGFEGITEGIQEIIGNAIKKSYNENQDIWEGVKESTIIGSLLGGFTDVTVSGVMGLTGRESKPGEVVETVEKNIQEAIETEPKNRTQEQAEIVNAIENKVKEPIKKETKVDKELELLVKEARKYGSAEEFIKAQGKPLYHGSPTDRLNTKIKGSYVTPSDAGKGIYFTDDFERANNYAQVGALDTATVTEGYLSMENPLKIEGKFIDQKIVDNAKKNGYDGIINKNVEGIEGYNEYVVFDPKNIKTKQQLIDIYNQATKKQSTSETINDTEEIKLVKEAIESGDIKAAKALYKDIEGKKPTFESLQKVGETVVSSKKQQIERITTKEVENVKTSKEARKTLSRIRKEYQEAIAEAEGKAVVATEKRTNIDTEKVNKLKRIYSRSKDFQQGDIETIRASKHGALLNNVIENVQENNPNLSEQEAFDYAMELPTKAEEKVTVPNRQAILKKQKALKEHLKLLEKKRKELGIKKNKVYEQEWQEALAMQEKLEKIIKVPRTQLPVGAGKRRASRLEARMKGVVGNATQEQIDKLGLTTYNQVNRKSNIEAASEFVQNNPEKALAVMRGEIDPPKGVLTNAVYVALKQLGKENIDIATQLATLQATKFGQEINILQELDPDNPVTMMEGVVKARIEGYERRNGRKPGGRINREINKINKQVKPPSQRAWSTFLSEIGC